jgi:hypothetical protein
VPGTVPAFERKKEMSTHEKALTAIMAFTITNLMDALAKIEKMAFSETATKAEIATAAVNAVEAAKALTVME